MSLRYGLLGKLLVGGHKLDEGLGLASFCHVGGVALGGDGNGKILKAFVVGKRADGAVGLKELELAEGAFIGALMRLAVALVAFDEGEAIGIEEGVGFGGDLGFGKGDSVEGPGGLEELAEPVFFGGTDGDVGEAAFGFEGLEFGLILGGDVEGGGGEAMAGGVLGGDAFAVGGAGSGGELGVARFEMILSSEDMVCGAPFGFALRMARARVGACTGKGGSGGGSD